MVTLIQQVLKIILILQCMQITVSNISEEEDLTSYSQGHILKQQKTTDS